MIILGVVTGFLGGCYYDVEEELYGTGCNAGTVTYSSTIKGLLSGYGCLGCHSGGNANGGVQLDAHATVVTNINRVWGAINHHSGYRQMPDGGSKMSPCDISKVKAWIDAGTPNN